jgi:hypothetical protein
MTKVPRSAPEVSTQHLLKGLIFPLETSDFISNVYRKSAIVLQGSGISRFENEMISTYLADLDLNSLVHNSASPQIFCWMKTSTEGEESKLESIELEPAQALICYNAGASLYFRAHQEMADTHIAALVSDLGMNFAGHFPTGDVQGEIEIFASRKGHLTNWHTDFMENFTVQLKGRYTPLLLFYTVTQRSLLNINSPATYAFLLNLAKSGSSNTVGPAVQCVVSLLTITR